MQEETKAQDEEMYPCDGCHCYECICDELEAVREEERGPHCGICGGYGWQNCHLGARLRKYYQKNGMNCPQVSGIW